MVRFALSAGYGYQYINRKHRHQWRWRYCRSNIFYATSSFRHNATFNAGAVWSIFGGIEHSAIHAAASIPCLLFVGVAPATALIAIGVEFVIHYHEDWLKEQIVRRNRLTTQDKYYWVAIGADQLVHQITYLGMVFFVLA